MKTRAPRIPRATMLVLAFLALNPGGAPAQEIVSEPRSPAVASLLSIAGTVTPIMLGGGSGLVGGLVLGPNLGDVYGRNVGYGLKRTLVRAGVAGATVGLAGAICAGGACALFGNDDSSAGLAAVVLILGGVVTGALAFEDLRDVDDRTRERNADLAGRLRVGPSVDPTSGRVGLAVGVRF